MKFKYSEDIGAVTVSAAQLASFARKRRSVSERIVLREIEHRPAGRRTRRKICVSCRAKRHGACGCGYRGFRISRCRGDRARGKEKRSHRCGASRRALHIWSSGFAASTAKSPSVLFSRSSHRRGKKSILPPMPTRGFSRAHLKRSLRERFRSPRSSPRMRKISRILRTRRFRFATYVPVSAIS